MSQKVKTKVKLNKKSLSLVGRLWKTYVLKYKWHILLALFFMTVEALAEVTTIKLLQPVVDKVFVQKAVSVLIPISIGIILLFTIRSIASFGQSALMGLIGMRVLNDIQKDLFDHLICMDTAFFKNNPTGTLISRFTADIGLLRGSVLNVITGMGRDITTLAFIIFLMFQQDAYLAVIVFTVFPVVFVPMSKLGRRMRKNSKMSQEEIGKFASDAEEAFQGIDIVKSYNMEGYEQTKIFKRISYMFVLAYKGVQTKALARPVMEFISGFAIALVVYIGGKRVIEGYSTPGQFLSFIGALMTAYTPIKSLSNLTVSLQEAAAAAQRIFTLIDIRPSIEDAPNAVPLTGGIKGIEFKEVSFSYLPDVPVIEDFSLRVKKGQTIAFVGASGSGKTTLLSLLPRFYDVQGGDILINDMPLKKLSLSSLRQHIGLVNQNVILFNDTVKENIRFGRWDATDAEIIEAAKKAYAHDFIMEMPEGYDSVVGEKGSSLSGGQRQRIAIARAILKNAPILLLDEATSALDTQAERYVQEALDELMKGKTTIVVAHRLSTIINADKIYVLEKGRIVESGTHEELLQRKGAYEHLYQLQFKSEEE